MLRQAAAFSGGPPEQLFASPARVPFPPSLPSHRVSPAALCRSGAGLRSSRQAQQQQQYCCSPSPSPDAHDQSTTGALA